MRAIFLDDAQKLYAKRLNAAFLLLTLVIMAAIFFALALQVGKELGRQEVLAQLAAPKPSTHAVKPVDVLSGNCIETARACFARKRMDRVRAGT